MRREKVPQKNLRIRKETENLICTKIPEKGKPLERVGRKAMGPKAELEAKAMAARLPVFCYTRYLRGERNNG